MESRFFPNYDIHAYYVGLHLNVNVYIYSHLRSIFILLKKFHFHT